VSAGLGVSLFLSVALLLAYFLVSAACEISKRAARESSKCFTLKSFAPELQRNKPVECSSFKRSCPVLERAHARLNEEEEEALSQQPI